MTRVNRLITYLQENPALVDPAILDRELVLCNGIHFLSVYFLLDLFEDGIDAKYLRDIFDTAI